MSIILISSIMIRLAAFGWSIFLLFRIRDWRVGFLTAMIGLMALRQLLTLQKSFQSGAISLNANLEELPGLLVSILAFFALVFLERLLRERDRSQASLEASNKSLNEEIANRTRSDKALQETLGHLRQAQKIAKLGCWMWNAKSTKNDFPAHLLGIPGISAEEISGLTDGGFVEKLIHPDDRSKAAETYDAICVTNPSFDIRYRMILPNGEERIVHEVGEATFDENGKMVSEFGTLQDITDRERAQEALRTSDERLRQAIELSGLGYYVWDTLEDRCLYCSEEHARIHGTSVADYMSRNSTLEGELPFVHPQDREEVRAASKALREGHGIEVEYRILTPDGKARYVREIAKPVFDETGAVVREHGTVMDTTETREAQERLRQSQRLEAIGQLTGGVAHDFNNLLGVILGNAELLERRFGKEARETQAVIRAAERGAELTGRLLAFSRNQPLLPQGINLGDFVAGMHDILRRTLGETIEIKIHSLPDLWPALADPGQLENAVLNLAINARDAMPGGGTLTIETSNGPTQADDPNLDMAETPGPYATLAISDTGEGMPAGVLERAFEPFFSTKDVGQGTGLGLSMVYGFIKQSGGGISLDSKEGQGTTVRLYLPRAETVSKRAQRETGEQPTGHGETVLVVEDHAEVRMLVVSALQNFGYQVFEAADGVQALSFLEQAPRVDLLLSDVVLPKGINGPEIAEAAKRRHPAVKVLFMSGYTHNAFHDADLANCGPGLMKKPFQMDELARQVRSTLGNPAAVPGPDFLVKPGA